MNAGAFNHLNERELVRALELHATVKQVQRSAGRSSVASSAYRAGTKMRDERTGIEHDYRAKGGVEFARLYAPDNAPTFARDRAKLWNAVELKENRKNSCTARELEIAFPYEFNIMQRREAGDKIAHELMRRYGCAVDIAYHEPSPEGDNRNYHAHIMFSTRGFDPKTKDGWVKTKYRDLNNGKMDVDGEKTTRGAHEVKSLRAFVAGEMNAVAKREQMPIKCEYKSYQSRGIEKIPTKKQGKEVTAMERKGVATRRAELNRRIKARNEYNFKRITNIQMQAERYTLKNLERTQSGGLFAQVLGLFTGSTKANKAKRGALQGSIARKAETIKNPDAHKIAQIRHRGNDNAMSKKPIYRDFVKAQGHSIKSHQGLKRYDAQSVLERQEERLQDYKKMANDRTRQYNVNAREHDIGD